MIIKVNPQSDFSIHNIPFGIFSTDNLSPRACSAIGDSIIDLSALYDSGQISSWSFDADVLKKSELNHFIRLGKSITSQVRKDIQYWLENNEYDASKMSSIFYQMADVNMHMPVQVGDYTDFYSSMEHATNIGKLFRDPENALLPNWKHLPVGYHGRASSIVISDTPIKRPKGQVKPPDQNPIFRPTGRLDFELEMGFVIGKESELGSSISTAEAEDYIFGMVLFNDWSARDIQKWEYVPLGPFLGKSFASTVSPWIVTLDALEPFKTDGPVQDPKVLPYLEYEGQRNYDIHLEVSIKPENGEEETISISNFKYMYWNMSQQLAHHTVNGCNVKVGDMMASGTISGKDEKSYGSLLEISNGGKKAYPLKNGTDRTFIEDGDTITLSGRCEKNGKIVGFGKARGTIIGNQ